MQLIDRLCWTHSSVHDAKAVNALENRKVQTREFKKAFFQELGGQLSSRVYA
jgi:hypothetical protein